MTKKIIQFLTLCAVLLLTACSAEAPTHEGEDGGEEVVVSVGNSYFPFVYLGPNEEAAGYDVEVLKAVDEQLDQYQFSFQPMEFTAVLPSLDAGQARIAAHQYKRTPEREAHYLFGDESYYEDKYHIVSLKDNDFNPQTLDDLAGKNVYAITGSNLVTMLEEYNEDHDEQINIVYGELNHDVISQQLRNGSVDAVVFSDLEFINLNNTYGEQFKISDQPFTTAQTFFIFNQGDESFKDEIDQAIADLRESGKLKEIEERHVIDAVNEKD